ncbi:MAG: M20/M25/M40 family metallo-hydrolase [Draconibacterium sp.]|nr:M20/M25/M40 family metallo-hydrolase [Draconibacterium sp.]
MSLQKISFLIFFLFANYFLSFSQNKALSKIDNEDLKRHLNFLSSDSLQGRKLGTEVSGLDIAADYIKVNAKINGLKPAANNYFQHVDMILEKPIENHFVEVIDNRGTVRLWSEKLVCYGNLTRETELQSEDIILLGFATDDSITTDIEGKVVVVSQSTPELFLEKETGWSSRLERPKIEKIVKKNPKAILFVLNPNIKARNSFAMLEHWLNRERYSLKSPTKENPPVLIVMSEVADALLRGNGKYKKYLTGVAKGKKKEFLSVKKREVNLRFGAITEPVEAKNIIGIIEGSDPGLKDEFIVFMAHYDHLGVDKDGNVFNGADDNGSGTVTLLEVAEAFSSMEQKPKRSIIFLWVTCEEIGLLGSKYYVENPIFPLEKTMACINIDMDGRVYEPQDSVWNKSPKKVKDFDGLYTLSNNIWPEIKEINNSNCEKLGLIPDNSLPSNFLRSSDHFHFHNNGIPIINYATGYHADYHKIGDEVSKINFDKMKRVADLCFLVGLEIANQDKIEFE